MVNLTHLSSVAQPTSSKRLGFCRRLRSAWSLVLLGVACQPSLPTPAPEHLPPVSVEPTPVETSYEPLTPRQLLIRWSLELRGVRPTEPEYAQVEAEPASLDSLLEAFLRDPRFEGRVRDLYAPVFRTRLDAFPVQAQDYGLEDDAAFQLAVGEEPLRMLGQVAAQDLPYTALVTADWTMANELLGAAWPLDYATGASGWQRAHYTDGRPAAGVLSTNALWWRYPSDGSNYNRGRANAVSRIFLCNDYSARPVSFERGVDLSNSEQVNNALRSNPACINCHSSLDGLSSHLFGFQYVVKEEALEASRYHPERERLWQSTTGVAPAYFGTPTYTLRDLGQALAGDPRFVECAVQHAYELLLDRPVSLADFDALTAHRESFLAGGLALRSLLKSVVNDVRYRSVSGEGAVGLKIVSPQLLASQLEDLTGYRFYVEGDDMLALDQFGLRSLAGGEDGQSGAAPLRGPTPSMLLVQARLAEAAAFYVTNADASLNPVGESPRRLFTDITFTETTETGRPAMVKQLQTLHRRLFGTQVASDGQEVLAGLELWSQLYAVSSSPVRAWAGVLSVLLRDPEFVTY